MTRRPSVVSVWTSHATGWHWIALDNELRRAFRVDALVDHFVKQFGVRVVWDDWTDGITVRSYALEPIDAEVPA